MSLRVLVTRDEAGSEAWAAELRRRGFEAVAFPCLEHRVLGDGEMADRLARALDDAVALAFSSRRGVEATRDLLRSTERSAELPESIVVAAVGPSTAESCREAFGRCDVVPAAENARGRALAELLAERLGEGGRVVRDRVILCAARDGRRDLEEILAPCGVEVRRFDVYETRPVETQDELPPADIALLASPSALQGLLHRAGGRLPSNLDLVAIGPTTSAAVRRAGYEVAAEASEPGLEGLIEAIEELPTRKTAPCN